ncbi:hypothetical protein ACI7YU_10730 [Pseudomonas siliginis]|uniref:hypothetical protein n=1 Tax=Pseudomonas siliginis TaxID=2842346 RepID=UPI00386B4814
MPPMPFYLDWQFWSAAAALTALILSQLSPIHILFRRAKLQCEAFTRLHITHKVGNPNAQWHLIIENTGGRSIRIKSISLTFRRTGGAIFTLPAQNYLRTPDATENVMLTPFRLAPGEEWAHVLMFFNLYTRDDEKEYRRLESAIRTDILGQKEIPENKERLCEASPASVEPAMSFFKRHFKWEPGEYELDLMVETDRKEANLTRQYLFSLFESESEELRDYSNGYKHGAGVYWVSAAQPGLIVPVREK